MPICSQICSLHFYNFCTCITGDVQRKKDSFRLGRDGGDDISFASVAKSGSSAAFSPPPPHTTDTEVIPTATSLTFATKVTPVAKTPEGQGSSSSNFKNSVSPSGSSAKPAVSKSVATGLSASDNGAPAKEGVKGREDEDVSNDLEVENIIGSASVQTSTSQATTKSSVKRKHAKSGKVRPVKKAKCDKVDDGDEITMDYSRHASRETICPESQPLPTFHREDGHRSDGDEAGHAQHVRR